MLLKSKPHLPKCFFFHLLQWMPFKKIVYKKRDERYNEWQRVTTSGTTSGTSSDNEWQRVVQRVITSDNEWQRVVQRKTTNDNKWQRVVQRMTTSDKEWQRVTISANFSFFQIREEPNTKNPKENSLNIEEDLWRRPIELRAETSP